MSTQDQSPAVKAAKLIASEAALALGAIVALFLVISAVVAPFVIAAYILFK